MYIFYYHTNNSIQHNTTQHNTTQHNTTQHNTTQHNTTQQARQTLAHQQLVAEVLSQLAFFRPDPKVIKRRIEGLIDREYLERDQNNQNTYKYMA
jgi:hypothetical protein